MGFNCLESLYMQIPSGSLVLRRPPIILINHRQPRPCSMHLAVFSALEVLDLRTNTLHGDVPENLNDGSFRAGTACRPSQDRVPSEWWWPAFSHRALGPMPLAACAERGVQWSGPSWRWEAVMERGFPVVESSDCASTMTKSMGSHWKMELQKEEVLSVLVRSRSVHLRLKAIR